MFLLQTISLLLPILVAGVFFVVAIKYKLCLALNRPIDNGVQFNSQPLFGKNKTWRGVAFYIVGSIGVCFLLWLGFHQGYTWVHPIFGHNPILVGFLYGASYSMGELINSFIKRRLGIRPGEDTGVLQQTIDTVDGMLLTIIVLSVVYGANWLQLLLVLIMGTSLHIAIDVAMKRRCLKK